jgi:hypothetical protein
MFIFLKIFSEWDGMMKELLEQRADMAIADLTITFEREQVCITIENFTQQQKRITLSLNMLGWLFIFISCPVLFLDK